MAQRMARADLLAARAQDDHGAQQRDAAAEIFDEIERGIVRPVHVLENEDRGLARILQRVQQRRKQPFGGSGLVEQVADRRIEPTHHVVEGAERTRGEERLAPPPQHLGASLGAAGKVLQERGFADAGFALDEHCIAVSRGRLPGGRRQGIEQLLSLKQHCHLRRRMVQPSRVDHRMHSAARLVHAPTLPTGKRTRMH